MVGMGIWVAGSLQGVRMGESPLARAPRSEIRSNAEARSGFGDDSRAMLHLPIGGADARPFIATVPRLPKSRWPRDSSCLP